MYHGNHAVRIPMDGAAVDPSGEKVIFQFYMRKKADAWAASLVAVSPQVVI